MNNHTLQNTKGEPKTSKRSQPHPPHTRSTCHRGLQPLYTENHQVSCPGFLPNTTPMQHLCSHFATAHRLCDVLLCNVLLCDVLLCDVLLCDSFPVSTHSLRYHFCRSPHYPPLHHFPRSPHSLRHHFPRSPHSLRDHFPRSPHSLHRHFPKSPLPFVTTYPTHHFHHPSSCTVV